jgi:REP element-mobilizing transposase RayT
MPRQGRIDAPGALHHIIFRGIERKPIFNDEKDYRNFLERLATILADTSTPCYAWALMSNHVHLLLRTGMAPIVTVMRRLLTGYAQQFNRRHNRQGHLFQNRYKSILCQEDRYLLELVRYIHLNPLRSGVVNNLKALGSYRKAGHSVLLGKVKCTWQDADYVLGMFGKKVGTARRAYVTFVEEGIKQGRRDDLVGGGLLRSVGGWSALKASRSQGRLLLGDERILGSTEFVESVLENAQEEYERITLTLLKGPDLNGLIDGVAEYFGVDKELLLSASKQRLAARARSLLCHMAINRLMLSCVEVAKKLKLSPSAVCKAATRGRSDDFAAEIEQELLRQ